METSEEYAMLHVPVYGNSIFSIYLGSILIMRDLCMDLFRKFTQLNTIIISSFKFTLASEIHCSEQEMMMGPK